MAMMSSDELKNLIGQQMHQQQQQHHHLQQHQQFPTTHLQQSSSLPPPLPPPPQQQPPPPPPSQHHSSYGGNILPVSVGNLTNTNGGNNGDINTSNIASQSNPYNNQIYQQVHHIPLSSTTTSGTSTAGSMLPVPSPQHQQQLQQQQQPSQQILSLPPMPSMGGTAMGYGSTDALIANSVYQQRKNVLSTAPMSSGTSRAPVNMTRESLNMVMEAIETEKNKLNADYELLRNMTLLNDVECLDSLYIHSSIMLVNPKFCLNVILSLYRRQYAKLYERYTDLEVYCLFCVIFILNRSEEDLKRKCFSVSSNMPSVGKGCNFLVGLRKRNRHALLKINSGVLGVSKKSVYVNGNGSTAATNGEIKRQKLTNGSSASLQKQQQQQEEEERSSVPPTVPRLKTAEESRAFILANHPFFQTDVYTKYMTIFQLGKLIRFCLPTSFAAISAQCGYDQIKIWEKQNVIKSELPMGLRFSFSIPIVGFLKTRKTNSQSKGQFAFTHVQCMEGFSEAITRSLGLRTDKDPVQLGSKQAESVLDLQKQNAMPVPHEQGKINTDESYVFVLINSLNVYNTESGILNMKSFIDTRFYLSKDWADLSQEDMEQLMHVPAVSNAKNTLENWYEENVGEDYEYEEEEGEEENNQTQENEEEKEQRASREEQDQQQNAMMMTMTTEEEEEENRSYNNDNGSDEATLSTNNI